MRYIFYHYNNYGTLVFDYYDEETHVTQSYVFYTLKQAISKFRKDNGLQYKRIKISKLFYDNYIIFLYLFQPIWIISRKYFSLRLEIPHRLL